MCSVYHRVSFVYCVFIFRKDTGMAEIVSYGLKDSPNLKIVSVIASFDTDGNAKPLYVRIGDESLKVYSVSIKHKYNGIIEYRCQVIDGNYLKPIDLTYHAREYLWTIPRIEPCNTDRPL